MNYEIPDEEKENILSVYWQMLREIEGKVDFNTPHKHTWEKGLVEAGYKVLQRAGCIPETTKPIWAKE